MADLTVATTIWKQLVAGYENKMKVMSWGVETKKLAGDEKSLTLKVNARRHKGWIKITLNGMDLYDVELIGADRKAKDTINGLYFDNLTEAIDNKIEKVSAYRF